MTRIDSALAVAAVQAADELRRACGADTVELSLRDDGRADVRALDADGRRFCRALLGPVDSAEHRGGAGRWECEVVEPYIGGGK